LWVIDLLGAGKVAVNDEPARWARLADGDVLRIGRFTLRICYDDEPPTGPRPQPARLPATQAEPDSIGPAGDAVAAPVPLPRAGGGLPLVWTQRMPHDLDEPLPAPPSGQGDPQQALLIPLVNQFAQMQQQMFDQFQQTILMMVEMFTALHQDQVRVVQDELDGLRALTRELRELQQELAGQGATATPPTGEERREPAPAAAADPTPNGNGTEPPRGPTAAEPPRARAPAVDAARTAPGLEHPGDRADIHLRIQQRIASIQRERQSRLQRILHYVMGE
jgi:hypothetical protein